MVIISQSLQQPITGQSFHPSQVVQEKPDPAAQGTADVQAEVVLETIQISADPEPDVTTSLPVTSDQPTSELSDMPSVSY